MKINISKTLDLNIKRIFIFFMTWICIAEIWRYYTFGFYSDGFLYWSALRNFAFYGTPYSGPVMEYLLGNHAYISLFLASPLIRVIDSPLLLLIFSVISYILSIILSYKISKYLYPNSKELAAALGFMVGVFPQAI